jgi:hypothetical protein
MAVVLSPLDGGSMMMVGVENEECLICDYQRQFVDQSMSDKG